MAIKLEIYLKRTEQSLESWIRDNGITSSDEFIPRCSYLGLAPSPADIAAVHAHFASLKKNVTSSANVVADEIVEKPQKRRKKDDIE